MSNIRTVEAASYSWVSLLLMLVATTYRSLRIPTTW